MPKLSSHLVYKKEANGSKLEIRKLRTQEVGISVTEGMYDFPFSRSAETFINKKDAIELIRALQEYFKI